MLLKIGHSSVPTTIDARLWTRILSHYREPSWARSIAELTNDYSAVARGPLERGFVRFFTGPLVGVVAHDSAHRRISSASIYDPA